MDFHLSIALRLRFTDNMISFGADLFRSPLFTILKNPARATSLVRLTLKWYRLYFDTQKKINPDQATVIETDVDDRIPPDERGIYPYLFASVYVMYIIWHVLDRLSHAQYLRTTTAYNRMIIEAERFFLSHPTRMRDRSRLSHPLTRFTQTIDGLTNCFPSLHVGLVVLSYQVIKNSSETNPLLLSALKKSCIDVCRSTMQTKQHSIMDVIGGVALTKRVYEASFEEPFHDLLDDILPELTPAERSQVKKAVHDCPDLPSLMKRLQDLFTR